MKITPLDIQQQQFKVKFRGFDVHEVDAFLEKMSETFESMQQDNDKLREEIDRLNLANQQHQKREESFKRTLRNSSKFQELIKEKARKSAESIVANAKIKAEKILNRAHSRLGQLHEDIDELKRQRLQIETQVRAIVEAHTTPIEMDKEEMPTLDGPDTNLNLIPAANNNDAHTAT